jgi:hypothetical protein
MSETQAVAVQTPKLSLAASIAADYGMEVQPFIAAVKGVVFPPADRNGNAPTEAQLVAYLSVCKRYGLDPFVKQLWPFPQKSGGFVPVASYDGWLYILNQQDQYDGDEYEEVFDDKGNLIAGVIRIFRKDRTRPITKKCFLSEWKRNTEPWNNQPHHMLELRTRSQGARLAFNISGIIDEDEAQYMEAHNITAESQEISRESLKKTDVLREKISAKKQQPVEPPPAPPTPEPPTPVEPPPVPNGDALEHAKETMRRKKEKEEPAPVAPPPTTTTGDTGSLFAEMEAPPEDRPLNEIEYKTILGILQSKCLVNGKIDKATEDRVTKAARQEFMKYGAANSKQLRLSNYEAVVSWAKALTV